MTEDETTAHKHEVELFDCDGKSKGCFCNENTCCLFWLRNQQDAHFGLFTYYTAEGDVVRQLINLHNTDLY